MTPSKTHVICTLFYRDRITTAQIARWLDMPEWRVWRFLARADKWRVRHRELMTAIKKSTQALRLGGA